MAYEADTSKPNRRRRRNSVSEKDRATLANRVCEFYQNEWVNRKDEREARLQRYAKYRLWSNGTDWPWPGASDVAIPDMLQDSLRVQDTLVNAVMSQRPPVVSKANSKEDVKKQEKIDQLINSQIFVENPGEKMIGELAESFVNDPVCTVFTPWVREKRQVAEVKIFPKIPEDQKPRDYLFTIVRAEFPKAKNFDEKGAGWDYTVTLASGDERTVCFYTDEADKIEMVVKADAIVFDGPCPFVKDYDDVLFPARSKNLQPPGPSNPNGATYVILRDSPTVAELKRLKNSGFYDLPTEDDMKKIEGAASTNTTNANGMQESQTQKDRLSGANETPTQPKDGSHKRLTRLTCFDTYDIDGDGFEEDVIFWVIEETKTLLKARLLSDLYPGNPPKRPLAGESFLPVGGRYAGMSLLEIMESMHDTIKVLVDQSVNGNDLALASPGFYRPSGGMNPEVLRIEPYTLSPLQNPQQDVTFPAIGNQQAMSTAMNMITVLGQWQDKLTMVTDHSLGQVAPGSSSALRTIGNMAMVSGQGEARPERILRRFFTILTEVWSQAHRLNQSFLPKDKQFRMVGVSMPGEDPYAKIASTEEITGNFQFDFDANVLNTSKASLQQALEKLMMTYVNPLMLQMGVVKPENIYRMARDYGKAYGQNVDGYLSAPTPTADQPQILAEEAIHQIMNMQMPVGVPLETGGVQEHAQKLAEFMQSDNFGLLNEAQTALFGAYLNHVKQQLAQDQQQQAMQQHAAAFQQGRQQGKPGAPPTTAPQAPGGPPMISGPNEMLNETLPSAGGGANQ